MGREKGGKKEKEREKRCVLWCGVVWSREREREARKIAQHTNTNTNWIFERGERGQKKDNGGNQERVWCGVCVRLWGFGGGGAKREHLRERSTL